MRVISLVVWKFFHYFFTFSDSSSGDCAATILISNTLKLTLKTESITLIKTRTSLKTLEVHSSLLLLFFKLKKTPQASDMLTYSKSEFRHWRYSLTQTNRQTHIGLLSIYWQNTPLYLFFYTITIHPVMFFERHSEMIANRKLIVEAVRGDDEDRRRRGLRKEGCRGDFHFVLQASR